MEGETITLSNSSESKKSVDTVSILVVDDDTTCLSIVAAILKKFKYQVVTVKHANDALCTLRIKGGAFDLVVSDVHMPDMNGFELQQAIAQEFNLPVVLMSADDKEGVALKGLESGAAFFIVKPVSADDLRDLWQFAAMKKKSQVVIEETGGFPDEKTSTEKNSSNEMAVSASSVNEDTLNKKDSKRKSPRKEGSDEKKGENSQSASQKKPKVIWTNSLHNRFLEAIRSIGLDRAVPKKILEVMDVPGLTRENVASHLQKYRIFLRRVSDASCKIQCSSDKGLSRNLRSSFESSGTSTSTLMLNRSFSKLPYQNPGQFPAAAAVAPLPNPESSSSSLITQSGFGQSRILSNKGTGAKPSIGNTNLIHQNDHRSYARFAQNNYQTRNSIQGHLSNISLEDLSSALSASFDASLIGSTRINPNTGYDISSHKNVGTSSIISSMPSKNFTYQTNYVGYSISNIKHLAESGHSEKYEGLNSCGGTINLPSDGFQSNSTVHATAMPNDNINLDQLAHHVGTSNNSLLVHNNGGEQLSDVIADYRMLLPSNLPLHCGVENGGEIFSPMFDLSELDLLSTQQPLEGGDFDTTLADQVNIQNQAQHNGGETITGSNFYCGMSHWDNRVPSFDQAPNQAIREGLTNSLEFNASSQLSKTLLSPIEAFLILLQRDDDDFLESLLAPFREDPTLEGI
ncbi:hypothetical protein Pfo_014863 [Paulownia fortunei]|nr:hypothetical protein Pfo_014863 [Paulownia fortunei]